MVSKLIFNISSINYHHIHYHCLKYIIARAMCAWRNDAQLIFRDELIIRRWIVEFYKQDFNYKFHFMQASLISDTSIFGCVTSNSWLYEDCGFLCGKSEYSVFIAFNFDSISLMQFYIFPDLLLLSDAKVFLIIT